MIKLDVDKFCENCDEFEPNVSIDRRTLHNDFSFNPEILAFVNTTVTCKHRTRCRSIKDYLTTTKEDK